MQKIYSIIPGLIKERGIIFRDNNNLEIQFCDYSNLKRYKEKKLKPFFVIDTFAIKTSSKPHVIEINLEELLKLGFVLTTRKPGNKAWMNNQRAMYSIEPIVARHPKSLKLANVPFKHIIQKDVNNNRVRLWGSHAYPHVGGGSKWVDIKISEDGKYK